MESAAQGEILSNDREVLVAKYHGPIEANDRNNFGVEDVMRSRGALKGRARGMLGSSSATGPATLESI
jgi:hypothetical protein